MDTALHWIVALAGVGQICLALASPSILRFLAWPEQLGVLRPLLRQVFWTYAGYILTTNLAMGVLSALAADWLLDGSGLAVAVCGYIATYWGARLVIQFAYYDRSDAPTGPFFRLAEVALVGLFGFLTLAYGAAVAWNLGGGV